MRERNPMTPLTDGVDFISCSRLYEVTGGYDSHGGRYDTAQRMLREGGWHYQIATDGWVAPWRGMGQ